MAHIDILTKLLRIERNLVYTFSFLVFFNIIRRRYYTSGRELQSKHIYFTITNQPINIEYFSLSYSIPDHNGAYTYPNKSS